MAIPNNLMEKLARGEVAALRARLLPKVPELPLAPVCGDYDLDPAMRIDGARSLAPAAVLLPIVAREEPTVLFTRRTQHLSRHAGQVSFPGGLVRDDDLTLVETALRETQEETGITAAFVTIAGFLDCYETGTGYAILPAVGLLTPGFELLPDKNEVAEIFEAPLAFLLDRSNRERRSMEWRGRNREFYAYNYGRHCIWGATAGILANLAHRLNGERGTP